MPLDCRRFRIAHIYYYHEIIEVTTFRALHDFDDEALAERSETGMILQDNVYGTFEEDILRRDFTVNAFYYDIADFSVIDGVQGLPDLQARVLRMIGSPEVRFQEDPIRILRALRFKAQLNFSLEASLAAAIQTCLPMLQEIPAARIYHELAKIFLKGHGEGCFDTLREYGAMAALFPSLIPFFDNEPVLVFIKKVLRNCDRRVAEGKPVTPAFLFAALYWCVFQERLRKHSTVNGLILDEVIESVLRDMALEFSCPRKVALRVREIWLFQTSMQRLKARSVRGLFQRPAFRAAYDFLLLRAECDVALESLSAWWRAYVEGTDEERAEILEQIKKPLKKKKSKA